MGAKGKVLLSDNLPAEIIPPLTFIEHLLCARAVLSALYVLTPIKLSVMSIATY